MKEVKEYVGINTFDLFAAMFIWAKWTGVLDWAWYYVLIPFYVGAIYSVFMSVLYVLIKARIKGQEEAFNEKKECQK